METFTIRVAQYNRDGTPKYYKVDFDEHRDFASNYFESKKIANLAAQLYELSGYDYSLWLRLFGPTLRMWGIQSNWTL